jgi:hypothetical protein
MYRRSELLIYEISASNNIKFKHDNGKVGKITVDGGLIYMQEVVKYLEWIVTGDHQWNLTKVDENSYKAIFPTNNNTH